MPPGAMEVALMLSPAHSQAKFLANWLIAPLVAPQMDPTLQDTTPATEEMKTMLPVPDDLSKGWASWHKWYEDSKFVEI